MSLNVLETARLGPHFQTHELPATQSSPYLALGSFSQNAWTGRVLLLVVKQSAGYWYREPIRFRA